MKFLKSGWVKFALAIAVLFAACYIFYPWGSWNYKVTVNVETPEGIKSGSAVRKVSFVTQPISLPDVGNPAQDQKGEAVVVDLGERGLLFAPMNTDDYHAVFAAFPHKKGGTTRSGIRYYRSLAPTEPVEMPLRVMPLLVKFKDIDNPKTVEAVMVMGREEKPDVPRDEQDIVVKIDRFEKLFGKGVKLQSITIEMTDEPVTWGIEKYLPWLNLGYPEKFIISDNDPLNFSPEAQITYAHMIKE